MLSKFYLKKGWKNYTQRSYEKAIKLSRRVKSKNPEVLAEAKRLEGLCYYKMHIYDLSVFALEKAIHYANFKNDWFNLSMSLARKGDAEKANKAFQNIYMAKTLQGYMHQMSIPEMILQFARCVAEHDADIAFGRIVELKQMYIGVNTSRSDELAIKGMPSLNAYLVLAKNILKKTKHPDPVKWLSELPQ